MWDLYLKKSLPKNELKNYRPVSNFSFISKILEKVVARVVVNRLQVHNYKKNNHLSNPYQSAYRKYHCTESTLLKVQRVGQELSLYLTQHYGTPCLCQYVMPKQFYHSGSYLNLTHLIWLSHSSSSAARLHVDEPALPSIMTHDHAKDLCTFGLGPFL